MEPLFGVGVASMVIKTAVGQIWVLGARLPTPGPLIGRRAGLAVGLAADRAGRVQPRR
jgi:hypothetical protein